MLLRIVAAALIAASVHSPASARDRRDGQGWVHQPPGLGPQAPVTRRHLAPSYVLPDGRIVRRGDDWSTGQRGGPLLRWEAQQERRWQQQGQGQWGRDHGGHPGYGNLPLRTEPTRQWPAVPDIGFGFR